MLAKVDPSRVIKALVDEGVLPAGCTAEATVTLRQEVQRAVRRLLSQVATRSVGAVAARRRLLTL